MFNEYSDVVTVEEVCSMLNIGKNNAYSLVKEGKLHAWKIGRTWKIAKESVVDYIRSNTKPYFK